MQGATCEVTHWSGVAGLPTNAGIVSVAILDLFGRFSVNNKGFLRGSSCVPSSKVVSL